MSYERANEAGGTFFSWLFFPTGRPRGERSGGTDWKAWRKGEEARHGPSHLAASQPTDERIDRLAKCLLPFNCR